MFADKTRQPTPSTIVAFNNFTGTGENQPRDSYLLRSATVFRKHEFSLHNVFKVILGINIFHDITLNLINYTDLYFTSNLN